VLVQVISDAGTPSTEQDVRLELTAGDLVGLPRRSRRAFTARPVGLRYLTGRQRRQALVLTTGPGRVAG
jgi:hypothetical protein